MAGLNDCFGALKGAPILLPALRYGKPDFSRLDQRRARNARAPSSDWSGPARLHELSVATSNGIGPLIRRLQFCRKDVSVDIGGLAKPIRLLQSFGPFWSGRQVLSLQRSFDCFGVPIRSRGRLWIPLGHGAPPVNQNNSLRQRKSVPLNNEDGNIAFGQSGPDATATINRERSKISSNWNDRAGCAFSIAAT